MKLGKKKTLCFIGNFYKTDVYREIANLLITKDVKIYWIIPKTSQYKKYADEFGKENVLLIDRTITKDNYNVIKDLKINEILYSSRVWKYDLKEGTKYLIAVQNLVANFIKKNEIHTIFGENTTAEELLICRLCKCVKELNCDYFSLMTTRIPGKRFYFFEDERQAQVFKRKNYNSEDKIDLEIKKPSYAILNDKIIRNSMSFSGLLNRFKRFITGENIEKTDPDVIVNKKTAFLVKTREVINQQRYKRIIKSDLSDIKGKKYVFYGFHKQPESSVDVCGRYMENQLQIVKNIWRQLPPDWYLVIKEHSNAIGDRSPAFFRELIKYPNVILIKESIDSKFIISNAQIVITNTGTMALEAALMGIPAITLSKVVFNCLNYCQYFTWERFQEFNSLKDTVRYIKSLPNNKSAYENMIKCNSFIGYMGDTFATPQILNDEENNVNLANAFYELVSRDEN